jgi:uncharacterized membrane protein YczE
LAVTARRIAQLLAACVVLGAGVALLLLAALGSDGYSTLVNGIAIATGAPFVVVNVCVAVLFVVIAAVRGVRPGPGTVIQPVLVGLVINAILAWAPAPTGLLPRLLLMLAAMPLLTLGVAAYLGSGAGAGPAEAAALAWDPPIRFRWSYSLLQGGGALLGWWLGAAIGPGTLLVIFLLGPAVDLVSRAVPAFDVYAGRGQARNEGASVKRRRP